MKNKTQVLYWWVQDCYNLLHVEMVSGGQGDSEGFCGLCSEGCARDITLPFQGSVVDADRPNQA